MNVYEIDDGEQWWFAADSKERALNLYLEPLVGDGTDVNNLSEHDKGLLPCPLEEIKTKEISPNTVLPVTQDDGVTVLKRTAAEWAADGEGLIAATVW